MVRDILLTRLREYPHICGLDGAWDFSSFVYNQVIFEADEAHRHEAAFALVDMHDAISICRSSRGPGEAGRPSFHAQLADPLAELNAEFVIPVDVLGAESI